MSATQPEQRVCVLNFECTLWSEKFCWACLGLVVGRRRVTYPTHLSTTASQNIVRPYTSDIKPKMLTDTTNFLQAISQVSVCVYSALHI